MQTFKEFLNESGLTRIWTHVQNHTCGAISGFRGENTKAQNQANNKEILAYLRRKGYSLTKVSGNYIENFGKADQKEVKEPSFFVVDIADTGNLEKDLVALGRRFDQDSVLIVPRGGNGAYLVGTSRRENAFPDFGQSVVVGSSRFGKVAGEFLSRIKGREFAFEEIQAPSTRNGKWGEATIAKQVEEDLRPIFEEMDK